MGNKYNRCPHPDEPIPIDRYGRVKSNLKDGEEFAIVHVPDRPSFPKSKNEIPSEEECQAIISGWQNGTSERPDDYSYIEPPCDYSPQINESNEESSIGCSKCQASPSMPVPLSRPFPSTKGFFRSYGPGPRPGGFNYSPSSIRRAMAPCSCLAKKSLTSKVKPQAPKSDEQRVRDEVMGEDYMDEKNFPSKELKKERRQKRKD